MKNWNF